MVGTIGVNIYIYTYSLGFRMFFGVSITMHIMIF